MKNVSGLLQLLFSAAILYLFNYLLANQSLPVWLNAGITALLGVVIYIFSNVFNTDLYKLISDNLRQVRIWLLKPKYVFDLQMLSNTKVKPEADEVVTLLRMSFANESFRERFIGFNYVAFSVSSITQGIEVKWYPNPAFIDEDDLGESSAVNYIIEVRPSSALIEPGSEADRDVSSLLAFMQNVQQALTNKYPSTETQIHMVVNSVSRGKQIVRPRPPVSSRPQQVNDVIIYQDRHALKILSTKTASLIQQLRRVRDLEPVS